MMARQWGGEHSGMQSYFQSVAQDSSCAYCTGRRSVTPLPKPLDAVHCISLQEQALRTQQAIAHFHRIGLCRHVTLYRPARGKNGDRAIWKSYQALARHAPANGRRHLLMLEDDCRSFAAQERNRTFPWDSLFYVWRPRTRPERTFRVGASAAVSSQFGRSGDDLR
jgi:hypothetical protein